MVIEIAVGYLFAWAVRKARRVSGRTYDDIAREVDAGMDRLHELVEAKLGQDRALERALEEATEGRDELSERTRLRLVLSLEEAAEQDPDFATMLREAIEQVQHLAGEAGGGFGVSGGVITTEQGSVATVRTGNVDLTGSEFFRDPAVAGPPGPPFGDDEEDA
ncbi:hypothetical protein [Kitasatospora azatica]|uniref:hypothetical protein n=1 Tax=Kitasatospora azatica TaxID=58347 RepID=UPI000689FBD6|nr:hypothetical protein [Kitasatospora azatica]